MDTRETINPMALLAVASLSSAASVGAEQEYSQFLKRRLAAAGEAALGQL